MENEETAAVLAIVAEFDDRVVITPETIRAWTIALNQGGADVEDGIDAVAQFYGSPDYDGRRIMPGDVSRICRDIRRDRAKASHKFRVAEMQRQVAESTAALPPSPVRDRKKDLRDLIAGSGIIRNSEQLDADVIAERHGRIEAIVGPHRNWPLVGDRAMRQRQAQQSPLLAVLEQSRIQQAREESAPKSGDGLGHLAPGA